MKVFATEQEDLSKLEITTMKGIKRTVRRLGPPLGHRFNGRLLGYEEARRSLYVPAYRWMLDHRGADLSTPLSHAALIAQRLRET